MLEVKEGAGGGGRCPLQCADNSYSDHTHRQDKCLQEYKFNLEIYKNKLTISLHSLLCGPKLTSKHLH